MNKNCVVVVETPLQLLCSFEVNYVNVHYIIRLTGQGNNDVQIINVAKFLGVSFDVISSPAKSYLSFFKFLSRITLKYYKTKSTCIFLGTYFSTYMRLISYFFKNVWYLDDGLATLKLKDEKINLYTFIDFHKTNKLNVFKHDFKKLKEKAVHVVASGTYFIGQPVVEKDILSEELYINYILKSVAECDGVLHYIPHRMESEYRINKLMKITGVNVLRLDMCIEVFFIKSAITPYKVYSYSSSALLTLSKLFPECILTFYIKSEGGLLNEKIYQQFVTNGVRAGLLDDSK